MSTRDPGRVAQGFGLVTGIAALTMGSIAAGFELERRIVASKLRRTPRELSAPEAFFSLRSEGPDVITPDGVHLHVEIDEIEDFPRKDGRQGEDKAVTIIFVHGYVLSLDCWHFQRKHFRGRAKLVFYDQRSHGRSSRSDPGVCRVPQLAEDLVQVIEATTEPDEKVVLIGHSMGGMTVQQLAAIKPEWFGTKVLGVGLVATSSGQMKEHSIVKGVPGNVFARLAEPLLSALNRAPSVFERSKRAGSDIGYVMTRRISYGSQVPQSYIEFMAQMIADTPIYVVADYYPAFAEFDSTEHFQVIAQAETAIVGGVEDGITPISHTDRMIELLPGAEAVRIPNSGHMGIIEHYAEVNEVLDHLVERAKRHADVLQLTQD